MNHTTRHAKAKAISAPSLMPHFVMMTLSSMMLIYFLMLL